MSAAILASLVIMVHAAAATRAGESATAPVVAAASTRPTTMPAPPATLPTASTQPATRASVTRHAVAFAVSPNLLVTAAAPLEGATAVRVQSGGGVPIAVSFVRRDADSGLAMLRAEGQRLAYLNIAADFAGGEVRCWSFPEAALFDPDPQVIAGAAPAPQSPWTVSLTKHPRLAGGPLLDGKWNVVGLELAMRGGDPRRLPAATLSQLRAFVGKDLPAYPSSNPDPRNIFQVTITVEP